LFCPKAFALIGELPDTVADRTIRIQLQRRTRDEPIERFRRRDVTFTPEAEMLRDRAADWCEDWLARARSAALALSTGDGREDDSIRARLLADIRQGADRRLQPRRRPHRHSRRRWDRPNLPLRRLRAPRPAPASRSRGARRPRREARSILNDQVNPVL